MTPAGPHHFAIKVRDLPAAERFYRDVLGLPVLRRWPASEGPGDRSVWLGTGAAAGTFLALETVSRTLGPEAPPVDTDAGQIGSDTKNTEAGHTGPGADHPGHHLMALRIAQEDRAAWEARLQAAGVAISHRTGYTIYFTDPEGNRLGLSHHPDAADRI